MDSLIDRTFNAISQFDRKRANRFRKHFSTTQALNVFKMGEMACLNHYWRMQLGLVRQDTINERECLVDGIDPEIWIYNFITIVIPTINNKDLPILV